MLIDLIRYGIAPNLRGRRPDPRRRYVEIPSALFVLKCEDSLESWDRHAHGPPSPS